MKKIKQNTNLLKVSHKFLNKECKKIIYYAHIQSHICYGLSIWENLTDNMTKGKIQNCMDTCFKLITHTTPNTSNYKIENMLTLNQLIELENMKLGYKLHHETLPTKLNVQMKTYSKNLVLSKKIRYNRRHKNLLNLPMATNKLYHNSYLCKSKICYNSLPSTITKLSNYKSFVKKCKSLLLGSNCDLTRHVETTLT